MTVVTLEVAKIRLRADASEADLLAVSERFQQAARIYPSRTPAAG